MSPGMNWNQLLAFFLPFLVFLLVLRRAMRETQLNTGRLWLYPAILAGIAVLTMAHESRPGPVAIAGFVAAALVGGGLGYLRARHQELTLDPATGVISAKVTPIGVFLVGGFFVLHFAIEFYTHALDIPHALGLKRATDAGLIFSFALMASHRWEIWKKIRLLRVKTGPGDPAGPEPKPDR